MQSDWPWLLLVAAVYIVLWYLFRRANVQEKQEEAAIALLLANGCCVERNRWHVYQSKSNEYILLHFNDAGNLLPLDEESFSCVGDAVSKFVLRSCL